jgi:hypothetical protein
MHSNSQAESELGGTTGYEAEKQGLLRPNWVTQRIRAQSGLGAESGWCGLLEDAGLVSCNSTQLMVVAKPVAALSMIRNKRSIIHVL